jgi:tetratricopeptide (TPR) repeat protein
MVRFGLILLIVATTEGAVLGGAETLDEARLRLLKGNYAEAKVLYEKAAKEPALRVKANIGIERCLRAVGEYDKALGILKPTLKEAPKNADVLAELAELYHFRGEWNEALDNVASALAANPDQFLAHWVRAQVLAEQGKLFTSGKELTWFVQTYSKRNAQGKGITDPEELLLVGLAAVERARRDPRLSDQFQFVISEVWGAILKKNPNYWPARFHRGLLFQEKYDEREAFKELEKALVINPQAAEVYASKGATALQTYQIADAEVYADQALAINPQLPAALRLKADILLSAGDTAGARKFVDKALKINPCAEATLVRLAVCHYLDHDKDQLAAVIAQVEKQNPKAGEFFYQLARRLDESKHFADARAYYEKALKVRPDFYKVRSDLGLLYMRLGQEKEAKPILDEAFKADPYHVRVFNTLKVLKHLESYDTIKTPHFVLRFDAKHDKILAGVMAKYLEEIYQELAGKFQYEPKEPILIELFNSHPMFSGRVVALPDLHTIGACTGRMIAMVSPHDKAQVITKPFNWNRVLRHELVHIFNLEQTNFLVPHWFTEGLAVQAENLPMPPIWNRLLVERVASGDLMNLDDIHLGFIRPGTSDNWQLAYLQSKLYIDYLTKTHGQQAIGGLLNAYRDGQSTAAAITKVCMVSKANFEKGYREYLKDVVKSVAGKIPEKEKTLTQLKEQYAKNPNNPDVAAALAEKYLELGNKDKARELADAAYAKQADHARASYVKAGLLLLEQKTDAAKKLLQTAARAPMPPLPALKLLGKIEFEAKNFTQAAEAFELGRQAEPYDNYWLAQLIRCYKQNGDKARLIATLKLYAPTDADDLASRRALAQLLLKEKDYAAAEKYAREALEIEVLDVDAQDVLLEALKAQNKQKELKKWQELLERH